MDKEIYPYQFAPIYKDKIWGGRNLERLYGRQQPEGKLIGESWELADLVEGVSVVSNGAFAGTSLTELTKRLGTRLLGAASAMPDGRFPLLLKLLDANDILSLQVHPDEKAVTEIPGSALKTECWYVVESRDGWIYKGVTPGVSAEQFRAGIEKDNVESLTRKIACKAGDFHFLPAGTVHAVGKGLVIAEVQTPSDTTYRVTDWGRGREIHVERSMQCIRFGLTGDEVPGQGGETLLVTEFFTVRKKSGRGKTPVALTPGVCTSLMLSHCVKPVEIIFGQGQKVSHQAAPGDTVLIPADCPSAAIIADEDCTWLEASLPDGK